jgi:ABC-2 type transport system ATP-binding protein
MISVTDFVKKYGNFTAVNGLSFEVPTGVVAAMVGPNGAGKTTTIRTLCGILRPTSGDLVVAGHSVNTHVLDVKRRTAYVPDDPPLFDAMTVWEHLRFVASSYRLADWQTAALQWLERFELMEKQHVPAAELSRGMRQKVAIVCAYIRSPRVLLLDEPMTGLDPTSIRTLKESIREHAKQGTTVLVSSHLLDLVEDLCTHLLMMRQGRALFSGTIQQARKEHGNETSRLEDVFFRLAASQDHPTSNQASEVTDSVAPPESTSDE